MPWTPWSCLWGFLALNMSVWPSAGAVRQLSDGDQLPGVAAEEELAERQMPVHQELHGQARAGVLGGSAVRRDSDAFLGVVCAGCQRGRALSAAGGQPASWQRLGGTCSFCLV